MKTTVQFLILSVLAFLSVSVRAQTAGETTTITAPTVPVGSNPKVTAQPDTQTGTMGPATAVFDQEFGETGAPAPTTTPEDTASPTIASNQDAKAPTVQMATTVGLTGVAAAAALL